MIETYEKLPVQVQAALVTETNKREVAEWADAELYYDGRLVISTLEGDMRVEVGDYVIRGVKGEFYPCRADIFESTYRRVET